MRPSMDGDEEEVGTIAARRLYPLLVGQIFSLIFTAALFILVARLLEPATYGLYSFSFGFQSFVDGIGAFGIGAYLSRELTVYSHKREFGRMMDSVLSGMTVVLPGAVLLTLIGVALSGYVANSLFPSLGISAFSLELVSLVTFFLILQITTNYALIGLKRSGLSSLVTVFTDIVQLALVVVLVLNGYGLNGAIAAMVIGYAAGAVLSAYFLYGALSRYGRVRISAPTGEGVRTAWNFSLPIAANNFLNTGMQNFGILFLGFYVAATTLGNYGAALRGLGLISLIYGTMGTVILPTFADVHAIKKKEEVNRTYNQVILYSLVIVMPMLIFITVYASPGLYVTVSGVYAEAPAYLAAMGVGTLLYMFGSFVSSLLIARGFTREVLKYNFISTVIEFVSIVALVYLLPGDFLKVIGAIVASFFIGNFASMILYAMAARKLLRIRFEYGKVLRLLASTAALGVIMLISIPVIDVSVAAAAQPLYANLLQLVAGVVLALLIYPPLIAAFRIIDRDDAERIKKAVRRIGLPGTLASLLLNYSALFMKRAS